MVETRFVIENIGQPGYEFISRPDSDVVEWAAKQRSGSPRYAEIGIGIGATALEVCRLFENRGEVHLFDFEAKVSAVVADLCSRGFTNVKPHPNARLHWDSYVWSLINCLATKGEGYFDYIYVDGAHTVFHDLPAYIVAKKLVKEGGLLDFDDYNWSFGASPTMNPEKAPWVKQCMTPEQIAAPQVKMIIDLFVEDDPELEQVKPKKVYRKQKV
jgi:hypothetical protein